MAPKLAGQDRSRTRRLLVLRNALTWHKLSMVHAKANRTNDKAPVNKLTIFEKVNELHWIARQSHRIK
jgi:hypothetical protein